MPSSTAPPRRSARHETGADRQFRGGQFEASRAMSGGTPSSSNMMRPGFTRQTQNSGEPLPLPMRTSAGFVRHRHVREDADPHPAGAAMWRVIARRAASIWRAVIAARSERLQAVGAEIQRRAALGEAMDAPLVGLAVFASFRISMSSLSSIASGGRGRASARRLPR